MKREQHRKLVGAAVFDNALIARELRLCMPERDSQDKVCFIAKVAITDNGNPMLTITGSDSVRVQPGQFPATNSRLGQIKTSSNGAHRSFEFTNGGQCHFAEQQYRVHNQFDHAAFIRRLVRAASLASAHRESVVTKRWSGAKQE